MLWRHFQKSEVSRSQSFSCKKMRFEPFTVSTSSWAWKICRNSSIVLSLFIKMNMTDNINYSDHIINHCGIHQQVGIACHKLSVECFQHIFILILHYSIKWWSNKRFSVTLLQKPHIRHMYFFNLKTIYASGNTVCLSW